MMKMVVHTFNRGVFYTLVGVAILTFLSGLALAGSDIVNPWTSQAKAEQLKMQTAIEAEKEVIELEHRRRQLEQERQLETARMQEDVKYQQQMNQIKLDILKWAGRAAIGLVTYMVGLGVFLFFWHRFHQMVAYKEASVRVQTQPQLTQVYLRPKNGAGPSRNGNGHVPYRRPPPPYTNMNNAPKRKVSKVAS